MTSRRFGYFFGEPQPTKRFLLVEARGGEVLGRWFSRTLACARAQEHTLDRGNTVRVWDTVNGRVVAIFVAGTRTYDVDWNEKGQIA